MEARTFDAFRRLTPGEREQHVEAYWQFLRGRDGEADVGTRCLDRREPIMRRLERAEASWNGGIDREGFQRCMEGDRHRSLDLRTEWVLAAARANEGERYGVGIEIDRYLKRGCFPGIRRPEIMVHVMLQESYHCRILVEMCRACGIQFEPRAPGWANRAMLVAIGALPSWLRWIPVMAGELVGTTVFRILHEHTGLFAEQPEVEAHLAGLIRQIWIDEVLHVAYLRALLGPVGLLAVRAALPVVAWAVLRDVPQLRKLGCSTRQIVDAALAGISIPDEIEWLPPDTSLSDGGLGFPEAARS